MKRSLFHDRGVFSHWSKWRHAFVFCVLFGVTILFESCCSCTMQRCSDEVVFVALTDTTGSDFEACESLVVRWSIDNASGEVTESEIRDNKTVFKLPGLKDVENGDIIEVGTKNIDITLYCNGAAVLASEYILEWDEYVCNKCSNFAWCDDEVSSTASIHLDVDPGAFPID